MKNKNYIKRLINNINKYIYFIIKYINYKLFISLMIILIISYHFNERLLVTEYYYNSSIKMNITSNFQIRNKIRLGIYSYCIVNGGRARITSMLVNYFYETKLFIIYLFTSIDKQNNEYKIPKDVKRDTIKTNLNQILRKKKIDILIYELDDTNEIRLLNNIEDIKVIFYQHSSNFDWIYANYSQYISIYKELKQSKYFITIIPFENNYLFPKWGINSILMNNFMTYEYDLVIPSNLNSKIILMIGRGKAKKKRFQLGIKSIEYISNQNINYKLKIISDLSNIAHLRNLVKNLNLDYSVQFVGFNINPEMFFGNASLNIFPSISEAFPMVIIETKIFGIPSILCGLDYIAISKGGTAIIYDDTPESLAKEALKIMKNNNLKQNLGKNARKSMKKFNNQILKLKWIELILSIHKGYLYYQHFKEKLNQKTLTKKDVYNIIHNQVNLLKMRDHLIFNNISIENYENFNYMETLKKINS